ncbi:hypothetical protein AAG906_014878 [Vitis piasezkii]
MDPKRRKTQDFADKADSTATDTGNSGIAESQATDSKAEPVELNAETRKSHYPKLMENRKSTMNCFREHHGLPRRQREQGRLGQQWWSMYVFYHSWTKLATIYVNQSRTRIMDLKITLLRLPKAQNLSEYMQIVQIIKDELAIINVPIDESDLTSRVLRNLSLDFKEISVAILSRDTSITFAELHNRLVEHEGFLKLEEKH